jgi:hypothetical protein
MKHLSIFFFVALGLAIGVQDVRAQNTQNADLHPPYLAEEESAGPEGEEGPVLEEGEEGEVIERGLRPFKFKKKSTPLKRLRPGLKKFRDKEKFKKKRSPARKKFRLKRRPLTPVPGSFDQPPEGGESPPVEPPVETPIPLDPVDTPPQPFTERELIHERIDFHAQRSLLRISKTNRVLEARLLFEAVNSGALGGIYKADTQVPALRAVRMGTRWFKLITQGQNAVCLTEPTKPGERPILVFRKSLVEPKTKMAEMDAALLRYSELCKFGVLIVTVREGGQSALGADVDVRNVGLGVDAENCRTPISGRCRFALPQNNSYDVVVSHEGKEQFKRVTFLHNEPEVQVEFNFGSGKGTLPLGAGVLLVTAVSRGKPIPGAEVRIIGADDHLPTFFGVTGSTGMASFDPLAGDYTVFVTKDGFEFAFQKVKVLAGVSAPVILNLTVIPIR